MADKPSQGGAQRPSFQVRIPLEWIEDDDVPIIYANQVLVSHVGPEFFLTFGTVIPPTNTEQLPDSMRIQPQVRVAISREAMPGFAQAIQENIQRWRNAQRAAQTGNAPDGTGPGGPAGPTSPPSDGGDSDQ